MTRPGRILLAGIATAILASTVTPAFAEPAQATARPAERAATATYRLEVRLVGACNAGEGCGNSLEVYSNSGHVLADGKKMPIAWGIWWGSRDRFDRAVKTTVFTGPSADSLRLRLPVSEADYWNADDDMGTIDERIPSDGRWHGYMTGGAEKGNWAGFDIRLTRSS